MRHGKSAGGSLVQLLDCQLADRYPRRDGSGPGPPSSAAAMPPPWQEPINVLEKKSGVMAAALKGASRIPLTSKAPFRVIQANGAVIKAITPAWLPAGRIEGGTSAKDRQPQHRLTVRCSARTRDESIRQEPYFAKMRPAIFAKPSMRGTTGFTVARSEQNRIFPGRSPLGSIPSFIGRSSYFRRSQPLNRFLRRNSTLAGRSARRRMK